MRAQTLAVVLLLTGTAEAQDPPVAKPVPAVDESVRKELEELRTKHREQERRLDAKQRELDIKQHDLEVKQRELERRLNADEAHPAPVVESTAPRFRIGRDGFVFGTADGKSEVRLRAVLHFDGRAYLGGVQSIPDTFLIRRARPFIEGTLFGVIDFRLMPDFAQGQATLQDAYIELHPFDWLRLRGGRFRVPIGLEWLQSDCSLALVERSLATDLVPWRDLGVMLSGDLVKGAISYALAMLNGAPDDANGPDFDGQTAKDFVGRVFLRPLRPTRLAAWTNLGLGIAASYGRLKGTAAATNLASYRSTGQQPIFSYVNSSLAPSDAVLPARDRWRVAPQAYWYLGPVGLMAEYVFSSQRVQRSGTVADIQNQAWNLTATFVLTLERAAYEGLVPKNPIDFRHKRFGAFELSFRYSELRIDPAAFPRYADPSISVRSARELAGGLNWHMTENIKLMVSYHRTDFVGGATMGGDREPENAILARLQLAM
jgi:phosphate-selective porin OprO/OprP